MKNSSNTSVTNSNNIFQNKITLIQFILSIVIVLRHSNPGTSWDMSGGGLEFAQVITDLTHLAVPAFFTISGFLFYRNISPQLSMAQMRPVYISKMKRRFSSLVIPYIFWNFVTWLFFTVCTHITLISTRMNMEPTDLSPVGIIKAILLSEYTPLWFVGNLIVYSILAPLIFDLLKNKYVGSVAIIGLATVVLVLKIDTLLIQWLPIYLIGCMLGLHCDRFVVNYLSEDTKENRKRNLPITAVALLLFIASLIAFSVTQSFRALFVFRVVSSVAVVVILSTMLDYCDVTSHELPWFAKVSFFICCVHFVQLSCFDKVALIILGKSTASYLVTYFGGWIIVLLLCILEAYILKKLVPHFYKTVCGGR